MRLRVEGSPGVSWLPSGMVRTRAYPSKARFPARMQAVAPARCARGSGCHRSGRGRGPRKKIAMLVEQHPVPSTDRVFGGDVRAGRNPRALPGNCVSDRPASTARRSYRVFPFGPPGSHRPVSLSKSDPMEAVPALARCSLLAFVFPVELRERCRWARQSRSLSQRRGGGLGSSISSGVTRPMIPRIPCRVASSSMRVRSPSARS